MKTFKMKALKIVDEADDTVVKDIELDDGLVINKEDRTGWLLEAYTDKKYKDYFESIMKNNEVMVQIKITRIENDPAFFITNVIAINDISETHINVIFEGKIVDHRKSRIEEMLEEIIAEGYQGESLLKKFKERI